MTNHLSILPDKLIFFTIPRRTNKHLAFPVFKNIFAPNQKDAFFSYTENDFEISIICSTVVMQSDFAMLDECPGLFVCKDTFRALQVEDVGAEHDHSGRRIAKLAEPLALAGISIFYVSTYQTDYILVKEHRMPLVIDTLTRHGFQFMELESFVISLNPQSDTNNSINSNPNMVQKQHVLADMRMLKKVIPETRLRLVGLTRDFENEWTLVLLRIMLTSNHDEEATQSHFFSFTSSSDGISLIVEAGFLDLFPDNVVHASVEPSNLNSIQVNLGEYGLDRYGVVFSIADPLIKAGITVMYLSTFKTAIVLVNESDVQRVLQTLEMKK